jgi:hypothetical protein
LLLSNLIKHCILHSQKLDIIPADINLWKTIESIAAGGSMDYGVKSEVHPIIAGSKMAYPEC